jgi:DNA-binding LytR/AlgR family response regulator
MTPDLKIMVVEDRRILAEDLIDRLHTFGYQHVLGPFASGEEALEASLTEHPDIAILDYSLQGKMNGGDLARKINQKKRTPIIYISQHQDDDLLDSLMPTMPVAFINKPFTNNELKMALVNAIGSLGKTNATAQPVSRKLDILDDRIFIRNGRGKYSILLDDVLWIQSGGGETSTVMTHDLLNKEGKRLPTIGQSLGRLEENLAFYPYLVRCSRYFILNLKHVSRILDDNIANQNTGRKILIIGDQEVKVGDKYRKNVLDRLKVL